MVEVRDTVTAVCTAQVHVIVCLYVSCAMRIVHGKNVTSLSFS